ASRSSHRRASRRGCSSRAAVWRRRADVAHSAVAARRARVWRALRRRARRGLISSIDVEKGITQARRTHAMLQDSPMYSYIPAKDVTRARRFYEETVGLKASRELAGGVVYEFANHTSCFLYPTPNAGTSKASQAFWQVADVEREVAELKS